MRIPSFSDTLAKHHPLFIVNRRRKKQTKKKKICPNFFHSKTIHSKCNENFEQTIKQMNPTHHHFILFQCTFFAWFDSIRNSLSPQWYWDWNEEARLNTRSFAVCNQISRGDSQHWLCLNVHTRGVSRSDPWSVPSISVFTFCFCSLPISNVELFIHFFFNDANIACVDCRMFVFHRSAWCRTVVHRPFVCYVWL